MKITIVLLSAAATVVAQDSFTATGVGCEPHGDHWHCPENVAEPTTPPAVSATVDTIVATASGVCEPHNDHWHCPSGVDEPTTPPPTSAAAAATPSASMTTSHDHDDDDHDHNHDHAVTATTCEPHRDHWHCPSGVSEPTTAPAQSSGSTAATTTLSAASAASSGAAAQSTGAAVATRTTQQGIIAILGAVCALFL